MMRLYLVRHAIADELPDELRFGDEQRALTAKGRSRFRRTAKRFARLGEGVDLVCTSPLLRSVQTAELLAGALGHDEVMVLDELRRDAAVEPLLARLGELSLPSIALVGHKRLLRELAASLAHVDADLIRFKRGSIARIDVRRMKTGADGKALWWLAPSDEEVTPGLPLDESVPA